MSRPEKPVDWNKVDQLLMAGCKGTEIAPHFDMAADTFYEKIKDKYKMGFTQYSAIKNDHGVSLLKAKQYEKAIKGDNTMLIWLGKNRCEQSEAPRESLSKNDDKLNSLIQESKAEHVSEQQTKAIDSGSEQANQHLDRSSEIGEDVCINPEAI